MNVMVPFWFDSKLAVKKAASCYLALASGRSGSSLQLSFINQQKGSSSLLFSFNDKQDFRLGKKKKPDHHHNNNIGFESGQKFSFKKLFYGWLLPYQMIRFFAIWQSRLKINQF